MRYATKPQRNQKLESISDNRENLRRQHIKSDKVSAYNDCWGDDPFMTSIEVPESVEIPTGILDIHGSEFVRLPNPIGFVDPEKL